MRQGLVVAQRNRHSRQYRSLLANLGMAAWLRGELEEAERLLRQARQEAGSHFAYQVVSTLTTLAQVRLERSDPEQAKTRFEEAVALCDKASVGGSLCAGALLGLADLAVTERDWTKAEMLYRRTLSSLPGPEPVGY